MRLKKTISNKLAVFIIFIAIVVPYITTAQVQPSYIQYLTDKGLQSNTIYNLYTAKNGLLYIAHTKGLSSFDGNSFTNYYNKDYPYTELTNIMETDKGDIFCKAFNNALYKKVGDSLRWFAGIKPYAFGFAPSAAYQNSVYSITNDSIIILNSNNTSSSISLNNATTISDSNLSIKFIGGSKNKKQDAIFVVDQNKNIYALPKNAEGNIHFCKGDVFFAKNQSASAVKYYNQNENLNIAPPSQNSSVNYISTTDSVIWICTTNGVFYRNKFNKGGAFTYMFAGFDVSDVKQTHEGGFFISTLGQGLLFVPNLNVQTLKNIPQNITSIAGNSNSLFVGTKSGNLLEYDIAKKSITINEKSANPTAAKFIIPNTTNNKMFVTRGNTQIGNNSFPFLIKDYCIVNSNIVLATHRGIYLYQNVADGHWINNYVMPEQTGDSRLKHISFSNEFTATIKYNNVDGKFYINNYGGILEMANGYKEAKKLPEPNCVLKDMCVWNGKLLLASKDKGILKWNGKSYETAFPENQTTGILYKFETYKNELWVLGEDAIFCYTNNKLITYNNSKDYM
jgi:hypothetical protein